MRTSSCNNGGFTLVELMFAMVITLVSLLGLLKAVEVATEHNLRNNVRDELVQVTEERMGRFRATAFSMISTCANAPGNSSCVSGSYTYAAEPIPSRLRGVGVTYSVVRSTVVTADGSAVNLGVVATWTYKGVQNTHEVHAIKANTDAKP